MPREEEAREIIRAWVGRRYQTGFTYCCFMEVRSKGAPYLLFESALAHGERPGRFCFRDQLTEFQSTLPHGERQKKKLFFVKLQEFQSTLPHGERPNNINLSLISPKFQSTLPHGERPLSR